MWGHLEPSVRVLNGRAPDPVKIAPTLIEVIDRYKNGKLPQLEKTTQDLYTGFMDNHLEPRWGSTPLTEIRAGEVQRWVSSLKVGASTKSHIMTFFRRLFKKAMLSFIERSSRGTWMPQSDFVTLEKQRSDQQSARRE